VLQRLRRAPELNGERVVVMAASAAGSEEKHGRARVTLLGAAHNRRSFSVRYANLARATPTVPEVLRTAVHNDALCNSTMTYASLEVAAQMGASTRKAQRMPPVCVECSRCAVKGAAGSPYCMLTPDAKGLYGAEDTGARRRVARFECLQCVTMAAAEAGVLPLRVRAFMGRRCMGAHQAMYALQRPEKTLFV
jgi:hypothetical protein